MASQFEETIRKHRTESEAIMRIVAPNYVTPPGSSYGRPYYHSGGGGGGSSVSRERKRIAAERAVKAAAEKAEQQRGFVSIVSTEHEGGTKLLSLGGIAALLRFPIYLE